MNLIIILLLIVLYYTFVHRNEKFGSSQGGALIQLVAKGAQDQYLTGHDPRYNYPYYYPQYYYPYNYYFY